MIRLFTTYLFAVFSLGSFSQNTVCLTIEPNPNPSNPALDGFTKYVDVLGTIGIYAESSISDAKVLHAAAICAELLDNDEDGIVDDQQLKAKLIANNTIMPVFSYDGSPAENTFYNNFTGCGGAVLYNNEVDPNNPTQWGMDASLEEILHTINVCGHSEIHPTVFGFNPNTVLTNAMDTARGGHFTTIPNPYPTNAWYTYDDTTCYYDCMATEYLYWCIASNMGALSNVCNSISNEWIPCTPALFQSMDVAMYSLITDPQWMLPQLKPDGSYCPSGTVLIESKIKKEIILFPNPATDIINIEVINELSANLKIHNILGQLVELTEIKNGKNQINISNLPIGIYNISINTVHIKLIKKG